MIRPQYLFICGDGYHFERPFHHHWSSVEEPRCPGQTTYRDQSYLFHSTGWHIIRSVGRAPVSRCHMQRDNEVVSVHEITPKLSWRLISWQDTPLSRIFRESKYHFCSQHYKFDSLCWVDLEKTQYCPFRGPLKVQMATWFMKFSFRKGLLSSLVYWPPTWTRDSGEMMLLNGSPKDGFLPSLLLWARHIFQAFTQICEYLSQLSSQPWQIRYTQNDIQWRYKVLHVSSFELFLFLWFIHTLTP